jgi:hypothetical protein
LDLRLDSGAWYGVRRLDFNILVSRWLVSCWELGSRSFGFGFTVGKRSRDDLKRLLIDVGYRGKGEGKDGKS